MVFALFAGEKAEELATNFYYRITGSLKKGKNNIFAEINDENCRQTCTKHSRKIITAKSASPSSKVAPALRRITDRHSSF
jgi:hemoglobin-like flavoprotein